MTYAHRIVGSSGRGRTKRALVALVGLSLVSSRALADDAHVCVPLALGVPGAEGPPEWLSGSAPSAAIDDPRWVGAASQNYGYSGTARFRWRALQAQGRLYVSFRVLSDPDAGLPEDSVYIGLAQAENTTHRLLRLQLTASVDVTASPAAVSISHLTWGGSAWQGAPPPTWVEDVAAWLAVDENDGSAEWTIQLKLDYASLGLAAPFKLWTGTQVETATAPVTTYDTYVWPLGSLGPWSAGTGGTPDQDITDWGEVTLGSDGCSTGISLAANGVGIKQGAVLGSELSGTSDNTFAAWPIYAGVSTAQGKVQARFRLAHSAAPNEWLDVGPELATVPSAGDGKIEKTCLQAGSPACPELPQVPANHCVLVELTSPETVTFLGDSALSAGCDLTPPSSQGGAGSGAGAGGEQQAGAPPDAGAAGQPAGSSGGQDPGGVGGAPSVAGASSPSGGSPDAGDPEGSDDDDGCSCTVPGHDRHSGSPAWLVLVVALLARRQTSSSHHHRGKAVSWFLDASAT